MKKSQFIKAVEDAGEAIITYRSKNSNKAKYNVCTLEFNNTYVNTKHNRAEETEGTVLLWCWDIDAHRLLEPEYVTSVVPLASALAKEASKNGR